MANSESVVKFREPPPFKITEQTKLEDWKNWLKTYRCYAGGANLTNKSHEEQISVFKSLIGPDAMKIYDNFSLLDITDVESVIQKFLEHFTPKLNFTVERLKFNRMVQRSEQNFEDFLAEVTAQAEKCNFGLMLNDFLLDKIVVGISDEDIRNTLLADEDLNYQKAVRICRESAKKLFMSKIDIGERKKDQKQDTTDNKPQKQNAAPKVDKSVENMSVKLVKKRNSVQKSVKSVRKARNSQPVEIEVPKLSVTTRRSARKLNDQNHDGEYEKVEDLKNNHRGSDDSNIESGGEDFDDWNGDDDFDDDDDEVDKTFEPEIKIRVRNIEDLVDSNPKLKRSERKKRRKKTGALKITVPPGEKPFTCHHCGFKCANKGYVRKHMNIHIAEKLYACDQCDYKSIRPQGLFRHKFRHTGEKPYACEICAFRCSHQSSLKKHIMGHTGEKPHACDLCDYRAIVADKLKMHRMKHHTGEKPFKCASCPFACTHKGNLKNHMLTHSETRPFACDLCDRRFNSNFHLKQHILTHTGERPFACHVCDFRSAQLGGLRTHLKRHTGEKPHVCHICGHRTSLKGNLKKHMLTHTGEKPYACTVCSYRSAQSSGLKTHMKVHTGEKPYVCDMCGYRCSTNGNLKQHMKTHKDRPAGELASQWQEPFTAVDPPESADYTNQENQPQQMQTLYVACQGAQRQPVIADSRSVLQREWSDQNPDGRNPDQNPNPNVDHSHNPNFTQSQNSNLNLGYSRNVSATSSPTVSHIQHLNLNRSQNPVNPGQNPRVNPVQNHNINPSQNPNIPGNNPNINSGQNPNASMNTGQNPVLNHIGHVNPSQHLNLNHGMSVGLSHCQNPNLNLGQNDGANLGQNPSLNHSPNTNQHHNHGVDQHCCGPRKDSGMYVPTSMSSGT